MLVYILLLFVHGGGEGGGGGVMVIDTMPINRPISDYGGTYVTIHSGYDHDNHSLEPFGIINWQIMIV